ncbi:DUF2793 domain-containing protein [Devosia ginsengisoli]|uniref:DUF2793 domain-containing protein n=1 Tax=Devosia ginsengisoli TaxID=400770 RepID=A0A5B8LWB2_9HYPH|nr:DUF2793 domain-containing protein [Devosia ginsengisoli]QDZ12403.1 DUF2793 domain-containing protein [Devosia ginsengisoli]
MDHTARLTLPFIMPSQAQKHITHNEAIQALDALVQPVVESRMLTTPPATPLEGEAWLVPSGATGAWSGHGDEIAAFQSGAWTFLDPAAGWQVYDRSDRTQLVFDAGTWTPLASLGAALPRLGVNTSADTTNRLAVASAATLLTHDGNGHQVKINKAAPSDTASLLYQTNWSGRAEMGLAGDDHWRLKVSPDGATWINALTVNATTGAATVAATFRPATDNAMTLGGSGARWSAVWSATGTIQTSDARQKTDIAPSDLGLDFILALEPVRYRWIVGGNEDGEARRGRRTHYGLLAQQVQAALAGADFAGHILADPTDPDSEQGLRYTAFIAPLIAAVQELASRVTQLERDRAG